MKKTIICKLHFFHPNWAEPGAVTIRNGETPSRELIDFVHWLMNSRVSATLNMRNGYRSTDEEGLLLYVQNLAIENRAADAEEMKAAGILIF